ncbi:hypothetical protein GWK47_011975 [Chionoecetes opilio]|uniref:Uncharacterized protein n=1 Tax=Chionoecetes opilio TaxID=41210 RepID=A0A8J4XWB1_CHIOP|nr:hypothetical protein GWK47_011975 [Chionoecetes opilio]
MYNAHGGFTLAMRILFLSSKSSEQLSTWEKKTFNLPSASIPCKSLKFRIRISLGFTNDLTARKRIVKAIVLGSQHSLHHTTVRLAPGVPRGSWLQWTPISLAKAINTSNSVQGRYWTNKVTGNKAVAQLTLTVAANHQNSVGHVTNNYYKLHITSECLESCNKYRSIVKQQLCYEYHTNDTLSLFSVLITPFNMMLTVADLITTA